jgi:four helix bundle protein
MGTYRNLQAWRFCHALALATYEATKTFPASERFGLASQLRRAAVSSCVNLAEGSARLGAREFAHFADISRGSLAELDALFVLARDLGYLPESRYEEVQELNVRAGKATFALIRALRKRSSR